jgi:glycosyltransferase involved in cell wall biosynthesis
VFAVSEDVKQHLVGEGFRPRSVGVIYNGIDVGPEPDAQARRDARHRLGAADSTFVIGTIARLDPVKNLGTLVRAAGGVRNQLDILVVVVGDGPERATLERVAADAGLEDRIRFLGQRDDARDWLAGCDAYVNSSISEGISLTILEAMAAALPVIATRVGGTPEIVDESCGRLVPARDVAALAAALGELASDADARRRLGEVARRRVETRFTIERMVAEYRNVYEEVGTQRPRRGAKP